MSALHNLWNAFRPQPRAPALILMYHRIARSKLDPWGLCVSPENFDCQLDWLTRHYRVIPVRQLAAELRTGNIPVRTVAITFDDGYADNLLDGEPILSKHGLPATFFLTTATLGCAREFWWDELERLLLRPQALPPMLHVTIGGRSHSFSVSRAAAAWDPSRRVRNVNPWDAAADTRLGFYYAVWSFLRPLDEDTRQLGLAEFRRQLGESESLRDTHRTLRPEEAKRLAYSPGVDIGAHSVTHSSFSHCSEEQQRWELRQSRKDLEALTGKPIHGFAYPYGDYASKSAQIAVAAGYEFACTTEVTRIALKTSLYLLPRLAVGNWGKWAFASRIRRIVG
jgi:peptidoglycan/xylan/chitin deacetylase (PgdA/CDA1 family)